MIFRFKHLFFDHVEEHSSETLPAWLNHRENAWFRDAHVLTLAVGASVLTDYWEVARTA